MKKEKDFMSQDFYCEEVLSGKTSVEKVFETEKVLAYYHTNEEKELWQITLED